MNARKPPDDDSEPVGDSNYGDYIDDLMAKGLHGDDLVVVEGQHGPINIGNTKNSEKPTVEFHPVIAPSLGISKETQRTLERMRTVIRNGSIALCLVGALFVAQTSVNIWQGSTQRTKDDATAKALQDNSAATMSLTEQIKSQQDMQVTIAREQQENQKALIHELRRRNNALTEK